MGQPGKADLRLRCKATTRARAVFPAKANDSVRGAVLRERPNYLVASAPHESYLTGVLPGTPRRQLKGIVPPSRSGAPPPCRSMPIVPVAKSATSWPTHWTASAFAARSVSSRFASAAIVRRQHRRAMLLATHGYVADLAQ